jgi:D-3-phosphoglycerate dehydrogenase
VAEKPKVVISDYDFGDILIEKEEMGKHGLEVIGAQCKTEEELIAVALNAHAIIPQYARVGRKTIESLTNCKVISRYGAGVDIVDVDAATEKGIQVTNVPYYCMDEVADHAMAMLLALVRKIFVYDKATHQGTWHWKSGYPIRRIRGSKAGLVAFGKIAKAIARRARAFGMEVLAYDPYVDDEMILVHGVTPATFETLIKESDYILIQAPLTDETRLMFGEREFRQMKSTAVLINTARGPIVDNDALYKALRKGWIAAAALDDIEEEPAKKRDWKPTHPLFELEQVMITPHSAYYSEASIEDARRTASREVVRVLTGKPPRFPVNFIQIRQWF